MCLDLFIGSVDKVENDSVKKSIILITVDLLFDFPIFVLNVLLVGKFDFVNRLLDVRIHHLIINSNSLILTL